MIEGQLDSAKTHPNPFFRLGGWPQESFANPAFSLKGPTPEKDVKIPKSPTFRSGIQDPGLP